MGGTNAFIIGRSQSHLNEASEILSYSCKIVITFDYINSNNIFDKLYDVYFNFRYLLSEYVYFPFNNFNDFLHIILCKYNLTNFYLCQMKNLILILN